MQAPTANWLHLFPTYLFFPQQRILQITPQQYIEMIFIPLYSRTNPNYYDVALP